MKAPFAVAALLCVVLAPPLAAHQRSESFSEWRWQDDTLSVLFSVTAREATRLVERGTTASLPGVLALHLREHVGPADENSACLVSQPITARQSSNGFVVAVGRWRCGARPERIRISAFFDLAPEHAHLAGFRAEDRLLQRYIHAGQTVWHIQPADQDEGDDAAEVGGEWRLATQTSGQGVRHVLTGADHLVFLLALLLVCRSLPALIWAITGFTIGHSVSLTLAVVGVVAPVVPMVEAVIGLTIAMVAAEYFRAGPVASLALAFVVAAVLTLARTGGLSPITPTGIMGLSLLVLCYVLLAREAGQSAWFRTSATVLFGLIHGLGFATGFQQLGARGDELFWSLAGFNVGVEMGQIAFILVAYQTRRFFSRQGLGWTFAPDAMAAAVCGMGMFWFAARSIGS